ncbi:MAG: segregation/condensation protein A [Candidatus Omnitrophica bacterium]|nr:segregation/condensation protein A [Candidatus Omnitrophota bacterium]
METLHQSVIEIRTANLSVRLPVFEGPLDLLLELIKKNEVNIYDIPITEITRQYIDYLNQMREMDLEVAGEFLIMAATLLYIKSKMLLPDEPAEEEELEEDPREALVRKLLEYQAFKEAASELGEMELARSKIFTRQLADFYFKDLEEEAALQAPLSADLSDLLQAFHKVLKAISRENIHEVFEQVITIDQKIEHIRRYIREKREFYFSELLPQSVTRNELIVTFLAMLEITRQKAIYVEQKKMFEDIRIRSLSLNGHVR